MSNALVFQYGPDRSDDCRAAAARWRAFAAHKLDMAEFEEGQGNDGQAKRNMAAFAMRTAEELDARARVAEQEGR